MALCAGPMRRDVTVQKANAPDEGNTGGDKCVGLIKGFLEEANAGAPAEKEEAGVLESISELRSS